MAISKATPIRFTPKGLCDSFDATDAFPGACQSLQNLVFDQSNPEIVLNRPGAFTIALFGGSFANAGAVSIFAIIGTRVYGMVGNVALNVDVPFIFDLTNRIFVPFGTGTLGTVFPAMQPTSGPWIPPTIAGVGTAIIITHPGFATSTSSSFGWFDVSNYNAPTWNTGNTATTGLPIPPVAVANFNNRAWFACSPSVGAPPNRVYYTDALSNPPKITNPSQFLVMGDNAAITALCGLPIQTTSSGIAQALLVFKATQIWQITGDTAIATNPLSQNFLSLTLGTMSPRSIVSTAFGTYFTGPTGPYMVDQFGAIRAVTHGAEVTNPDIIQPFLNCTEPTRVAAAYTGSVYRVCLDSIINGTPVRGDYWFDEHVRRWNGPHTFTYDCAGAVGNPIDTTGVAQPGTFLLVSNANPATFFYSRVLGTLASIMLDSGVPFNAYLKTASFPKTGRMAMKQVVESTIEIGARFSSATFNILASDDQNTALGAVAMTVTPTGSLWGQFLWGGALWSSAAPQPSTYAVPWATPLVFEKIQLEVRVFGGTTGCAIGTFYARFQETGYQTMNQAGVSVSAPGATPQPPYGAVAPGIVGQLAWYVTQSLLGPISFDNATLLLSLFGPTRRGLVPPPGTPLGFFLRDDGTWQPAGGGGGGGSGTVAPGLANQLAYYPANGSIVSGETLLQASNFPALTGDVTNVAGSLAMSIASNAVQNADLAQMPANTIKGNNTGALANALDLTPAQVTAMLSLFTTTLKGLVPPPGAAVGNFLRDDGTWQPGSGGGGGSGTVGAGTTNQLAFYPVGGTSVIGETFFQAANMPALTGDVTNVAGSLATLIAAHVVTPAKMAQAPAWSVLANMTGSVGDLSYYAPTYWGRTKYTANITLQYASDTMVFVDANAGSFIVTIPSASLSGTVNTKAFFIKRVDTNVANTVTLQRTGSDLIEGASTYALLPQSAVILASDGNVPAWYVL